MGDGIVFNGTSSGPMNIDNKVKDNTIYNCYLSAIKLDHVQTLEISGNIIYANNRQSSPSEWGGSILLRKSGDATLDYENKDLVIHNNRIHSAAPNGNGTGIAIQSARNVRITYNDIYLNDFAGIVAGSNVLLGQIVRNSLRNNRVYQAWDNGVSMVWDDGSRGNYWSDYNGTGFADENNDGIGDVPYTVRGPKGSKDFFPLVSPIYFIATTVSTVTTISASSTAYRFTTTTTIPTYWFTTIYVPLTSYLTTIQLNTTTTYTTTSTSTTSYSMALTTFYATSTSYVWTVSVSTTATLYSTTYTSTTATTTTTSTSTSTTGTTATVTSTATQTATSQRCVIASAAYGSELSPAVQFLRDFRDHEVVGTFAGAEFIKAFNAFYYSFSPTLAESISENDNAKVLTRVLITPLVAVLQTGEALTWGLMPQSELKVIVAGLISSSLIGLLYSSPIIALSVAKAGEERKRRGTPLKYLALVWICSLIAVGIAEVLHNLGQTGAAADFIMMVSTGLLVLSTMILSPLLLLKLIRRLLH
jgi:peptide/nickel transport system substrate-binding protein